MIDGWDCLRFKDMGRRMIIWVHWVVFEKRSFDTARCILGIEPMGLVAKVEKQERRIQDGAFWVEKSTVESRFLSLLLEPPRWSLVTGHTEIQRGAKYAQFFYFYKDNGFIRGLTLYPFLTLWL